MKRKAVIAIMLMLSLILSACSGNSQGGESAQNQSQEESNEIVYGEFKTAFRFLVTSDNHVSTVNDESAKRLKKLFESAYAYADTQDYKRIDAFVAVGDITNYGKVYEYQAWKSIVDSAKREETEIITVMGNHEFYGASEKEYTETVDERLNKHINVNGYHFIGISTKGEGDYSDDLDWLAEELEKAAKEAPDKPIITFQHHHIKDTVYVSSEWYAVQSKQLNDIYSKYSQIINFSGHSHGPINNPTSCYQKDYTLFGTGTLAYFEMTSGMTYGTIPPNANNAAQFYIVEISEDNRVRVMPYNLLTDNFFKTYDGSEQLVYRIDNLFDKSTWLYTDKRIENSANPEFSSDAQITVGAVSATTAEITFPQASDDDCVYSYNIVCTDSEGNKKEFNYFSEYYFEPLPETLTFSLSDLDDGKDYSLEVFPIDVFGKRGEPIKSQFTTPKAEKVDYTSQNDVNFVGTFTNFDSLDSLKASSSNFTYGGNIDGDIFVGTWNSASGDANSGFELVNNGYKNSKALSVYSNGRDNQGLYLFATDENKNTSKFPSTKYLRVWVDFSDIEFRKANFGLIAPNGDLYTTDESDYVPELYFYYLPEGETEWKTYVHGADGCFGVEQETAVKGFKGFMAFPVKDFTYRYGTGAAVGMAGEAYPYNEIAGLYMFWNYSSDTASGTRFVLDEIALVEDYTVFTEYNG